MSSIEVVTPATVYEVQQRVKETAPAEFRTLAKHLEWHHTKNFREGQENDAYYWMERWASLWSDVFEFRFNPTKAIPVRPEVVTAAPFNMAEALQEALEADESQAAAQA